MKKLRILAILILISSCSYFKKPNPIVSITKDCGFYRIVRLNSEEKKYISRESKETLVANNIDACEVCPRYKDLDFCKGKPVIKNIKKAKKLIVQKKIKTEITDKPSLEEFVEPKSSKFRNFSIISIFLLGIAIYFKKSRKILKSIIKKAKKLILRAVGR